MTFKIEWLDGGREAKHPANPAYPDGIVINVASRGVATCTVDLTYPAPCCGSWQIECETCGFTVAITAAGRADDPRAVKMPCRRILQ